MKPKIKVFFVCSGLGNISRGFESFTEECFATLKEGNDFQLTLFKGAGNSSESEIALPNISRDRMLGKLLGWIVVKRGPYFIEQLSFFLSLLPYLEARRPDVVVFSDGNLGNILWHWKRFRGHKYKLLCHNGGPMSPPFPRWDFVHQISSLRYELARLAGHPDDRQMYIPIGSEIPASLSVPGLNIQAELRGKLGLPQNQLILLSVAAINASHKRLDYVVRELAALPGPRPFLVMLGQMDAETPRIFDLADSLLGSEGYLARTVKRGEVEAFYSVSDLFVLASLNEGMGKVLVEALAHGLPCLAHDYPVTREVLGEFGNYADFSKPGNLTNLLRVVLRTGRSDEQRHSQHSYAYRAFSWKFLREKYVAMLTQAAKVD